MALSHCHECESTTIDNEGYCAEHKPPTIKLGCLILNFHGDRCSRASVANSLFCQEHHERVYGMPHKFQCDACASVEHGYPKKICGQCNLEFTQIRNLVREMSRRMQYNYADLFVGLRTGINKLVDQINHLKALIK